MHSSADSFGLPGVFPSMLKAEHVWTRVASIRDLLSAIELYAEAFESVGCLNKLENFASVNGAKFYGLDVNTKKIKLEEKTWVIPESVSFGDHVVVPLRAGTTCKYKLNSD